MECPNRWSKPLNEYKTAVDPTSLWVETRYTGKEDDTVPTGLLFDDYMKFARENEINLSDNFDSRRFGSIPIMKKLQIETKKDRWFDRQTLFWFQITKLMKGYRCNHLNAFIY